MTNSDKNPSLNDLYSKLILIGSWLKKLFLLFSFFFQFLLMCACYSFLLSYRLGGGSLISLNKQVNWAVYCL